MLRTSGKLFAWIIIAIGAFTMLFPFLWMVGTSFKSRQEALSVIPTLIPKEWNFKNYQEIWSIIPLINAIKNTLIIELLVITCGTFVSSLSAFSFAKLRLPYKNVILMILLSTMMIPYAAVLLPQYRAFERLSMTNTLWPLILPGLFGNVSMMFFLIQYMKGIPDSIFEAARIDGASYFRMYAQILLPLIRPALAAQIIIWFIAIWNDYFAPSIYLTEPRVQTLQVLLQTLNSTHASGTNYPLIMTGAVLASLPMIIVYIVFQKYIIHSLAISGIKG